MTTNLVKRWLFYIVGLVILALGISLTIKGRLLGLGSWDVLHYGLWQTFGLTIGSWAIIAGATIVLSTAVITRRLPKLGVYINMVAVGVFIDIFNWLIPEFEGWTQHIFIFTVGLFVMAFGVAFYITPNLGAGPPGYPDAASCRKVRIENFHGKEYHGVGCCCRRIFVGRPGVHRDGNHHCRIREAH